MSRKRSPGSKYADNPKSMALMGASWSLVASTKFSGFRSRCITPRLWQCAIVRIITRNTSEASFSE